MKRISACYLIVAASTAWCLPVSTARGETTLYCYDSSTDPASEGWHVSGAGEQSTLVSIDGALIAGSDRKPGWLLCDRAANAGMALTYGGSPWAQSADWSVTMQLRWEENAYDASGNLPAGGNNYYLSGNRQSFRWRVGNGATGYYEVLFGKGSGSTITASGCSPEGTAVPLASFGQDVALTLAVTHGEASLMLDGSVVLEHLELTLSQQECNQMMFGDPTGGAQGCVTLHSVSFVPEPSVSVMALAAAAAGLARRRRANGLAAGEEASCAEGA